jgi:hypothetical protein
MTIKVYIYYCATRAHLSAARSLDSLLNPGKNQQ